MPVPGGICRWCGWTTLLTEEFVEYGTYYMQVWFFYACLQTNSSNKESYSFLDGGRKQQAVSWRRSGVMYSIRLRVSKCRRILLVFRKYVPIRKSP